MSRIGKQPLIIPSGVNVSFDNDEMLVQGTKGELKQKYISVISFNQDGNIITVARSNEEKKTKALHGLYRKLLSNMVQGVSNGFSKVLMINGIGYRAELKENRLLLNLGYSMQFQYVLPEGITAEIEKQTIITVKGIDKAQVGQVAAEIRSIRPVEPYKGKGIRYENEIVRRKVGKKEGKKK